MRYGNDGFDVFRISLSKTMIVKIKEQEDLNSYILGIS